MSQQYLFLFTISPVQAFISQARKAQDLFAGSEILSDLMKCAYNFLDKKSSVIFPALPNEEVEFKKSSATHRILALIEKEDIKELGANLESEVRANLRERLPQQVKALSGWEKQFDNLFEFYWVAKLYSGNHREDYRELEQLLGGVKNTRYFRHFEEKGRKCSLDGVRNVRIYRQKESEQRESIESLQKRKIFHTEFKSIKHNNKEVPFSHLAEGEGLSAVSYWKRLYAKEIGSFPSTAKVCLLHLIHESIEDEKHRKPFCDFMNLFKWNGNGDLAIQLTTKCVSINFKNESDHPYDDELLFEENLIPEKVKDKELLRKAIVANTKWKNTFADKEGFPFTKYYALLRFDGDSMGKWLSGEYFQIEKDHHEQISKKLNAFALEAKEYLSGKFGKAVYAGGDDFLGFVNIRFLFEVLEHLRMRFYKLVAKPIATEYSQGKLLSFSAGVCIAHYRTPLASVLNFSEQMQEDAKKEDGKNALGICVIKGSGETEQSVLSMGEFNESNIKTLQHVILRLWKKEFSTTFITALNQTYGLFVTDKQDHFLPFPMIETELKRLLLRAAKQDWNKEQKRKEAIAYSNEILKLLDVKNLKAFLALLNICDFMVRKTH